MSRCFLVLGAFVFAAVGARAQDDVGEPEATGTEASDAAADAAPDTATEPEAATPSEIDAPPTTEPSTPEPATPEPATPEPEPEAPPTITWSTNATSYRGMNGERIEVVCPGNGTFGTVYGGNPFTDDSSICTAAVYAGAITRSSGGLVVVVPGPPQDFYSPQLRNDVATKGWAKPWPGSFAVVNGDKPPTAGGSSSTAAPAPTAAAAPETSTSNDDKPARDQPGRAIVVERESHARDLLVYGLAVGSGPVLAGSGSNSAIGLPFVNDHMTVYGQDGLLGGILQYEGIGPLTGLGWLAGCAAESGLFERECPLSTGLVAGSGYRRWVSAHGGLTLELGDVYGGLGAGFDFASTFGKGSFGGGPDLFLGYVGLRDVFIGAKLGAQYAFIPGERAEIDSGDAFRGFGDVTLVWLPFSLGGVFVQVGAQAAVGQVAGADAFEAGPFGSAGIVVTNEVLSMKAATICTFGLCR